MPIEQNKYAGTDKRSESYASVQSWFEDEGYAEENREENEDVV